MDKRRVVCSALVILAWAIPVRAQVVDAASGAAIQKAQEAQARQRAYRVAGTSRTNETNSWSLVYVSPDRYHYKETTGPALQDEIIMTGGEGWLNETRKKAWEPAIFDHSRMLREEFRAPPSIDAAGYRVTSVRALPASEVNGATAATYEYVVEKNKDTWRVTMWVTAPLNLPVKYRAETDQNGTKSTYNWEIVYDDSLKVESPAALVVCRTGEQCLDFGMRLRDLSNLPRAAEFYDKACKAGSWQGCLGYASHLVGLMNLEGTSAANKAEVFSEAVSLLDRVIKARPTVWRAYLYKGLALRSTAVSKEVLNEGQALMTRAKTLAAQSTDADAKWDAVLWPPPR